MGKKAAVYVESNFREGANIKGGKGVTNVVAVQEHHYFSS
jgi:hypothetical protein